MIFRIQTQVFRMPKPRLWASQFGQCVPLQWHIRNPVGAGLNQGTSLIHKNPRNMAWQCTSSTRLLKLWPGPWTRPTTPHPLYLCTHCGVSSSFLPPYKICLLQCRKHSCQHVHPHFLWILPGEKLPWASAAICKLPGQVSSWPAVVKHLIWLWGWVLWE